MIKFQGQNLPFFFGSQGVVECMCVGSSWVFPGTPKQPVVYGCLVISSYFPW